MSAPPGSYDESLVGRTLNGVYRLVDLIGSGGFAAVYLARDLRSGVTVAVKVLHADVAREPGLVRRFAAEAEITQRMQGPNVARILGTGTEPTVPPYLVMEYVQGLTLEELVSRQGPRPFPEAMHIADQMLAALSEAHTLGIIHRDIKPANVMVDHRHVVRVMDFGIARLLQRERVTTMGRFLGTAAYMAPEQIVGDVVDVRTDLYAVAVVIYELLSGSCPFETPGNMFSTMARVANEVPPSIHTRRPDVPPAVSAVIDRALAKAPDRRFGSAGEMRHALAAAVAQGGQAAAWRPVPSADAGPVQNYGSAAAPQMHAGSSQASYRLRYVQPQQSQPTRRRWLPAFIGAGVAGLVLVGGVATMLTLGAARNSAVPTPLAAQIVATPTARVLTPPSPSPLVASGGPLPTAKPVERASTLGTVPVKPDMATATSQPAAQPTVPPTPQPTAPPTAIPAGPTPRPTATPWPAVKFHADFQDGTTQGLVRGRSANETSEYLVSENEYVIKTLNPNAGSPFTPIPNSQIVSNGTLTTQVRVVDGSGDGYASLGCRRQATSLPSYYAALYRASPPSVRIHRWDEGKATILTGWESDSVIQGSGQWHTFELRCIGNLIEVAVNGVPITRFRDDKYVAGNWLMGAGAFSGTTSTVEVRFDNVDLRAAE